MKPNVPVNNLYNRNPSNFFQQQPAAFQRALPMYSVTNTPIAMMNYFNAPNPHVMNHDQDYAGSSAFQHAPLAVRPSIPIDLVWESSFVSCRSSIIFFSSSTGLVANAPVEAEL